MPLFYMYENWTKAKKSAIIELLRDGWKPIFFIINLNSEKYVRFGKKSHNS
jgi:hypothetical protein